MVSGAMGYLLDGENEHFSLDNALTTFEIEELIGLGDKNLVPVLLYLFHRIEESLDGSPAQIILDEAWIALGHPVFKEKIREWLKVLRKANCHVVLATQSLSDAVKSGILDVLQESCPTKILLPNPNAFNKGTENTLGPYDFYKMFGLNDAQINVVCQGEKKREYYYMSPLGSRLFNMALGEINLAFTAAADKAQIKIIKRLISEYGIEEFPFKWLEHKNIAYSHLLRKEV
jgi:type IV secretion system protein TrbE